jgi:hypothetical protein
MQPRAASGARTQGGVTTLDALELQGSVVRAPATLQARTLIRLHPKAIDSGNVITTRTSLRASVDFLRHVLRFVLALPAGALAAFVLVGAFFLPAAFAGFFAVLGFALVTDAGLAFGLVVALIFFFSPAA